MKNFLVDAKLSAEAFALRHPTPYLLHYRLEQLAKGAFQTMVGSSLVTNSGLKPSDHPMKAVSATTRDWLVMPLKKRSDSAFGDVLTTGRAANCDVVLPYGDISKMHAYFSMRAADDTWVMSDNGSRNGSFVDADRLAPKTPRPLGEEAYLFFAQYPFLFVTSKVFQQKLKQLATLLGDTPQE